MTEKRFTRHKSIDGDCIIYDELTDFQFPSLPILASKIFCNKLNDLNDKNKSLSDFRGFIDEEHQKLKEENIELKKQLRDCQQEKQNIKDFLMNSEAVVEQKELQKLIYRSVGNLIDEKIKELKDINNISIIPRESIEILKDLKKELQVNE